MKQLSEMNSPIKLFLYNFRTLISGKLPVFALILMMLLCNKTLFAQTADAHHGGAEFIENKAQWNPNVLYKLDINGGAFFAETNCFTFAFKDETAINKLIDFKHTPRASWVDFTDKDFNIKCHAYKVKFLNSNSDVRVSASEPFKGYYNYYIGNDKSKWASKVHSYARVEYRDIYEKTDLNIYESGGHIKYDIILHPGAKAGNIQFLYDGADKVYLEKGNLIVKTSVNKITELSPLAYQMVDGAKVNVPCKYKLKDNVLSFVFPDGFDASKELVIDPTLVFSTYSGSTVDNWGFTATFDSKGSAFSGGIAFGTGYPVSVGAYQGNFAGGESGLQLFPCDVAIIKYDSTGTQRMWATYLGGSKNELPHSMIVNSDDDLLVYGTTGSADFPVTSGAFDASFNGGSALTYDQSLRFSAGIDIFVSKLKSDGSALLASTFVGGTSNDGLNFPSVLSFNYGDGARGEIMTDAGDNVYVVSTTNSTDFPVTPGAFQTTAGGGGQDGIVFKLAPDLTGLIWSSYIGGSNVDAVYGIVVDYNNDVYITGGTSSSNFPVTSGCLHTSYMGGTADGFISKISSDGSTLVRSTYYGSDSYDQSYLIEKGPSGKIYVFGQTSKTGNAFIQNATLAVPGGGQFVSKIEPDLNTLIWSTALGTGNGGPDISPNAFLVDDCSKIYLSGWGGMAINAFGGTTGLPITPNAFQSTTDGNDFYFFVMNDNASTMIYATYFGSPSSSDHVDGGTSRFDRKGIIYNAVCAGCWGDSNFPTTPGAWSRINGCTKCNNAVVKFDFQLAGVVAMASAVPEDTGCLPFTAYFTSTSNGVSSYWNFDDPASGAGDTSIIQNPQHTFNEAGTYHVIYVATDSTKCNISDTAHLTILVRDFPTVKLGVDTALCTGEMVVLDAGNPGRSYLWSNGANTQTITVSDSGRYWVAVLNGACTTYDTVEVKHRADFSYTVPNVFTPNGDGYNDTFKVKSSGLTEIDAQVFNRWGKLVYKWTDPLKGWDGKIKGTNASEGVYYYVIKLKGYCGEDELHGFVTLMK
ncbi:MAG: gliding motility-associated C-terminal domain-containing protein [Bacteroidota bacterium]